MPARAFPRVVENQAARFDSYYDLDEPAAMFPGERVGAPLARKGLGAIAKVRLVMLAAAGAGAVLAMAERGLLDVVTAQIPGFKDAQVTRTVPAATEMERAERASTEPEPATAEAAAPLPLPEPAVEEKAEAPVIGAAAEPYEAAAISAAGARLEPPVIDRDDPYQAKALAAGLHPGLSRVLLAKLTPDDYRNAAKAIQIALAETPDDGVLAWPRKPAAGGARFEVHFVTGAAPECRRYVVTVTLGGWSTTALPMERCGAVVEKMQKAKAG